MEAQTATIIYRGPAVLERAFLAAGLAGAILASQLLPGYPLEWRALLPLAVLLIGLWSTIGAYLATIAVLAYPIWQLSPYLMVLFIAATIIPHRLVLNHLPLALLIAWSPVLAALRLDLAIPLLVGVVAGSRRGAFAGALAALWIKLYAAMSGNPLDLLQITGMPGSPGAVATRFAGAGSLDTLQLIGAPFAPNSSELLGHVLQIAALAGAGAAAGWLAGWGRTHLVLSDLDDPPPVWLRLLQRFLWTGMLPVVVASAVLVGGLLLAPLAVGRPLSGLGLQEALDLLTTKLTLGGGATLALVWLMLLAQPLPPGARRPARSAARPADRKPAPPVVLPPPDLTPIKTGRFVPGWAAQAGLAAPLPPEASAPDGEPEDLVDILMQMQSESPAGALSHRDGSLSGDSARAASVTVLPPARDIAIELD